MKEMILQYLMDFGSITTWDAIREFGCTRLSHYIWALKRDGHKFKYEIITTTNRYGNPTHFKKYILDKE